MKTLPLLLSGWLSVLLVVGLLATACHGPKSTVPAAAELPIAKVVLYQNGVGYFEKRGMVDKQVVELRVRPDQINDVLKSLAVLDLSGGAASAVSLPVDKSGDRLAAELPAQVRNATGMVGLLAVLRGADVTVEGRSGTLQGRVVGVEMPPGAGREGDGKPSKVAILTLMVGDDQLSTMPVESITKLTIGDRTLSVGLKQSLDISKADGAWKPVSLQIRLAGDKTHDLIVSYIHEVPVWRPAYRAWVEKDKGVQLQGWAIVDNTSGEDWNEVKLTLVVGSPLSFRYNLHTPHMVDRPDLSPRLAATADAPPEADVGSEVASAAAPAESAAPEDKKEEAREQVNKKALAGAFKDATGSKFFGAADEEGGDVVAKSFGGADSAPAAAAAPMRSRSAAKGGGGGGWRPPPAPPKPADAPGDDQKRRDAAMRSAQALVSGREVGALFAYEAQHPVTVPDRSAALINLLNKKLDGRDIILFRDSGQLPYRAILLKNDNAASVEGGPITLYIDGTFAGEGFIGRVGKSETAFVPYARESGVSTSLTTKDEEAELHLAKIVDGRIRIEGKRLIKRTFSVDNTRDKPMLCYIKISATSGMTLREPPKDLVKAGADLYVPVAAPAKGKAETVLVEESPVWFEDMTLTDRAVAVMQLYLKNVTAEEAIKGPITQLLAVHQEMATIDREIDGLRKQREVLDDEQRRIQGNLDALPASAVAADLRRQLVGQLEAASTKAALVAKKLVEGEVKLAALKEKMITLLRGVSLK